MKKCTVTAAVMAAAFTACGLGAAASAAGGALLNVVALGDSTASGTGAGDYYPGTQNNCWLSANSYSEVAVAKLRAAGRTVNYTSVACSGASSNDLRTTFKEQRPQLDALKPDTNVVLLTVGANGLAAADPICTPTVFSAEERAEGNKIVTGLDSALRSVARLTGSEFVSPLADSVRPVEEFAGRSQRDTAAPYYRGFDALALGGLVAAKLRAFPLPADA